MEKVSRKVIVILAFEENSWEVSGSEALYEGVGIGEGWSEICSNFTWLCL